MIEDNGNTIYSLLILAEDAQNISVQFSKFILSKNTALSIYTKNELTDSITFNENNEKNIWATRVYQGSYHNKKKGENRTTKMNSAFALIPRLKGVSRQKKPELPRSFSEIPVWQP